MVKEKKEFTHEKIEICKISKESIDTTKEQYVILVDCTGKKVASIGFYKLKYLKDLMKGKGEIITNQLMGRSMKLASGMLEKMGITKKMYDIQ